MTELDQQITDTLLIIKNYIDVAIQNNAIAPTANNLSFYALRLSRKTSVARIALLLGIPAARVVDLETGTERLTVEYAMKLGEFYGVSADSLI